ncbi:MAG TPA: NAD(P)-dependent oxidoreductase [Lachnospiraceae bacterium]|nr:NAD(P)-dependent oxidoreductase [Lachnospiraceae bacterium]
MKKAIITGATGMLGLTLAFEALRKGDEVYAVIRPDSVRKGRLTENEHLHIVPCDLAEMKNLPNLIPRGKGVFYHMGWANTGRFRNRTEEGQNINVAFEEDAVRAAAAIGCTKFIGAGSQAEYGPKEDMKIGPLTPAEPVEFYGMAKLKAMEKGKKLSEELGMPFIWMRIFSTYGPYDKSTSMIAESLGKLLRGEPTAFTPATQIWDYLYSEDAARAFYLAGEKGRSGAVYCVGSGCGRPLREFIEIMCKTVDPKAVPGIGKKPFPPGKVRNLTADITSLTADTGFVPQVSFEEGIAKTAAFMKNAGL